MVLVSLVIFEHAMDIQGDTRRIGFLIFHSYENKLKMKNDTFLLYETSFSRKRNVLD